MIYHLHVEQSGVQCNRVLCVWEGGWCCGRVCVCVSLCVCGWVCSGYSRELMQYMTTGRVVKKSFTRHNPPANLYATTQNKPCCQGCYAEQRLQASTAYLPNQDDLDIVEDHPCLCVHNHGWTWTNGAPQPCVCCKEDWEFLRCVPLCHTSHTPTTSQALWLILFWARKSHRVWAARSSFLFSPFDFWSTWWHRGLVFHVWVCFGIIQN